MVYRAPPTAPASLTVHRVTGASAGRQLLVLATELVGPSTSEGQVQRAILLFFDLDAASVQEAELTRGVGHLASLDLADVAGGWVVVGTERAFYPPEEGEQIELWSVRIDEDGAPSARTALARSPAPSIDSVTLASRSDGEVDVYAVDAGRLVHALLDESAGLGPQRTLAGPLSEGERFDLTSTRAASTTCLLARALPSGAAWLMRLEEGAVEDVDAFTPRGVSYLPVPSAGASSCTVAYYEPDARHPAAGRVRVHGPDAAVLGWGGVHPLGSAWLPELEGVALAVRSADSTERPELSVVRATDPPCRLPRAELALVADESPGILGALASARVEAETFLVLAGVGGRDSLGVVRVVPSD